MRQVATTYQHLVGEEKDIAMAMAGLPHAISTVLNDKVLTFLNRARKVTLGPLSAASVRSYYVRAFEELDLNCSEELVLRAADASEGFPYLVQLVGYYLLKHARSGEISEEILALAVQDAQHDMNEKVLKPMLKPLSNNDIAFLRAMSEDEGATTTASLQKRLGEGNSFIQPYRARLIEAGLIESPRKGELVFAVPHLADYLRNNR